MSKKTPSKLLSTISKSTQVIKQLDVGHAYQKCSNLVVFVFIWHIPIFFYSILFRHLSMLNTYIAFEDFQVLKKYQNSFMEVLTHGLVLSRTYISLQLMQKRQIAL